MSNTVVRTNVMSLNSHRNLGLVSNQQSRASQRLSSGFRINSAADDAAGLGISEKMRSQIRGLDQASRNAQDGISLIQTAEGAMSIVNEMVARIRELVVQAANDTNAHNEDNAATWSQSDRTRIQDEINQLMDEIDATADRTQFNTRQLIDGSLHGLSPSNRIELNSIVGRIENVAALQNLNLARNNLAATDAAIASMRNNLNQLGEFQAVVNNILGQPNINALIANNNWADGVAAATGLSEALAAQLNATGMFGGTAIVATDFAFTSASFAAPVDGKVQSMAAAGLAADNTTSRNNLTTQWLLSGNAGYNVTTAVTPGDSGHGGGAGTAVTLTVANFADVGTALTAARDLVAPGTGDWSTLRTGNLASITTQTNILDRAVRQFAPDWNTAEAMLNNPGAAALWFQVGANTAQGVNLSIADVSVDALNRVGAFPDSGVEHGFNFSNLRTNGSTFVNDNSGVMRESGEDINKFLTAIDFALSHVSAERSNLGAMQNRLEFTIENLDIASENLSAANSRIRDADMAQEMMRLTQANVLQQAAISMLAQANQAPQSVLQLLG